MYIIVNFRYNPPLRPVSSVLSLELPESPLSLQDELRKQVAPTTMYLELWYVLYVSM